MKAMALAPLLAGVSVFGASAAWAQPASAPTPVPSEQPAEANALQDIVVTAQRREENLQNVPVAVTAVTAAQLTDLRITSIRNLSVIAPGLQINTQGRQTVPTVNIRGISSGSTIVAVDPKVGIYVDGVYIGRVVGSVFEVADIERVEVLRGPQGTLFGRNATGGAISIVSAAPRGEFGVRGTVSYGNYDAKRAKISLDLPSVGPFSARISYLHDDIKGDVRNLIGGQTFDVSRTVPQFGVFKAAKRLGGRNVDGVLVSLRGEFGAVQADYRFDYTDSRSVGRVQQSYGVLPADALGRLVGPILALQPLYGGITNISTEPLDAVANAHSVDRVKTQGHSLTLTADATDWLTLKSISSYRKMDQAPSIFDLGASGGLLFSRAQLLGLLTGNAAAITNPANRPGPRDHFFSIFNGYENHQQQWSQETQATITTQAFDLIAGAFYFHEQNPTTNLLASLASFTNGVLTPVSAAPPITQLRTDNDAFAFYAQGTYHLTDSFDLTGGLRYSIDDRGTEITSLSGAQVGSIGVGNFKASFKRTNYAVIATWRPTEDITTYAKVSTAYVSGGIYAGTRFDPEDLTAYEVGIKSKLFDNHLRLNLAAYQNDYKDLQTQVFANGISTISNAGKARIRGAEAELELVPVRGLTISGNLSYVDFKYREYVLGGVDVAGIARPPFTSKWTGRASIGYSGSDFGNGAHPIARLDASYRSKVQLGPLAVLDLNGQRAAVDRYNTASGYWLLDGRIGIADLPVGRGGVSISAFGQNLLDKDYTAYGVNAAQLVRGVERGRTYGIELGFDF
ncbi:TonB-dependent receptor [Sphingomonas jatrophae]|uniref:Iron complex outermembrane recepter protein n=1 Tax=Sphingomonas jatrophae TaxID=1166337 RepID=A0A1I6KCH0_9SPHN|nr:TonB-dependent receptor [Sphingomonas jatrophae]SFR88844.1 iron complex outermembrane recepter protein [Sphingomonas jatrophae]